MTAESNNQIYIYNTLTRKKELFTPIHPGEVSIYVCGPTVYNYIHIGNARPLIFFDVVRRYFEYLRYSVTYVQNITDIDDKIIAKANEEGKSTSEIAEFYTKAFLEDCEYLGVKVPTQSPKATEYVPQMIELIKTLQEKDFAYEIDGNVFFDTSKYSEYGKLSGKDLDNMETGERVDDSIQCMKKNPRDFTLWKPSKPGEPVWDSPWGQGRPGWHTECVVMSTKLLGKEFDIHGGGADLVFPHHENEIAQARCGYNAEFANVWMHNEFVTIREEKMAKSVGNVVLVRELKKHTTGEVIREKKYSTEAIRLFFLQTNYRNPISFSYEILDSCQNGINKNKYYYKDVIEYYLEDAKNHESEYELDIPIDKLPIDEDSHRFKLIDGYFEDAIMAMNDDFNTAIAVSCLIRIFNLTCDYARLLENADRKGVREFYPIVKYGKDKIDSLDGFLGIIPKETLEGSFRANVEKLCELIKLGNLLKERQEYRKKEDWEGADRIRRDLESKGRIEDKKDGTRFIYNDDYEIIIDKNGKMFVNKSEITAVDIQIYNNYNLK